MQKGSKYSDRWPRDIIRRMENTPIPTEQPFEAPEKKSDDTIVFKRSHFYAVLVVLAFSAGILVGYMAWGRAATTGPAAVAAQPQNQPSADAGQANAAEAMKYIVSQARHIDGNDNAKVVIVEFSDYQ